MRRCRASSRLRPRNERDQRQGHDRGRKDDVRDQNREVHDPDRPFSLKRPRAHVGVIDQVRDQEQRGHRERADHRRAVPGDLAPPDEVVAREQKQPCDAVERGVERGKVGQGGHGSTLARVAADEHDAQAHRDDAKQRHHQQAQAERGLAGKRRRAQHVAKGGHAVGERVGASSAPAPTAPRRRPERPRPTGSRAARARDS